MTAADRAGYPAFLRLAAHPLRWQLLTELARSDLRVRELVARVREPQNLVSYHLRVLRAGGLVSATRSSFDARDSYYRLDLDACADGLDGAAVALHPSLRTSAPPASPLGSSYAASRPSVLFVCSGNSARSPLAEALMRRRAGDHVHVTSAGTRPKDRLHPDAVRVLGERHGIDLAHQRPRPLDLSVGDGFDHIVTLCDRAREQVGEAAGRRLVHWSVADPVTSTDASPRDRYLRFVATAADI